MSKRERPLYGWDEQDAFTGWRHSLYWKPGEIKRIKRLAHKKDRARNRQALHREIQTEIHNY